MCLFADGFPFKHRPMKITDTIKVEAKDRYDRTATYEIKYAPRDETDPFHPEVPTHS